jgi:hypothetical protein
VPNVTRPDDNPPDPQAATPYFRRCAVLSAAVQEQAAVWGLPPDPLAA